MARYRLKLLLPMLTSQDVLNKRPNFMTPIELSSSVVHVINGIQNSLIGRGVDLGLVIYWKIMNCKCEAWLLCHCSGLGCDLILIDSITTYILWCKWGRRTNTLPLSQSSESTGCCAIQACSTSAEVAA